MHKINVLLFATFRTYAGCSSLEVDLPDGATVSDLKALLAAKIPAMESSLEYTTVAINRQFSSADEVIPTGAEVALFPPVSGG